MLINIEVDQNLLNEALNISEYNTKTETVTVALEEFIASRKKQALINLLGTIDYDKGYNYKEQRGRNNGFE